MRKWKSPDFDWHRRSKNAIAHGSLTNSKRPKCFIEGIYPTHIKAGQGCVITDTQGIQYIDFICGLGSNLLGYGHPEIAQEISKAYLNGSTLSLGSPIEIMLAEKIKELFPFVDLMRFLKTGSDACLASLRIARTYTNRTMVLSQGYHGHGDEFVSLTKPALGVPPSPYVKSLVSLDDIDKNVAAVIVEPIITDISHDRIQWLKDLREKCTKTGTVLIFDEIITGFRWPNFSVSNHYSIYPDLICLGKAMGNGMPVSVVGGNRDIMDCGEWFISSTFAGETCSLSAAFKTIVLLQMKYSINSLWNKAGLFKEKFNSLSDNVKIDGYPTRGTFVGSMVNKALFWQEACKAGILFGPSFFYCFPHDEVAETVLNICSDIFVKLKTGQISLEGNLPESPFAQQQRGS